MEIPYASARTFPGKCSSAISPRCPPSDRRRHGLGQIGLRQRHHPLDPVPPHARGSEAHPHRSKSSSSALQRHTHLLTPSSPTQASLPSCSTASAKWNDAIPYWIKRACAISSLQQARERKNIARKSCLHRGDRRRIRRSHGHDGKELEATLARLAHVPRVASTGPATRGLQSIHHGLIKATSLRESPSWLPASSTAHHHRHGRGRKLSGARYALFMRPDPFPVRMQGAFVSEEEVEPPSPMSKPWRAE